MRLHRPHLGFVLAWGGDLGEMGKLANWPTRRRRDLDAVLNAEATVYGTAPAASSAGWAPATADLLERVREGLSRYLDRALPAGCQQAVSNEVEQEGSR